MRESNFSNPAQNKACVCISATLYDRRAIDCTATLPLINSLNHLAYLTSTSPRIREMVTLDGGLERLIRILRTVPKSAPSPGGSLIPTKASTTMEMQAIWKWSLAFQCVVNIGVRGSETVRTRVVEAGMVPVTVGVLESYLKMVDAHKQESKKEDRERESRERREERERERQRRAERHSRQNGDEGSNGSSSQRLIGNSSTDRSSRHTRENYIEEISESQAGPSNLSSSASSSTSSSRSNRQTTSNLTSTSRAAFNNTSDVTMQLESDPASIEISSVIPITSQTASSRPDDVEVVEAGSTTNNVNNDATTLSSFSDATEMVMSMASGSGTLTNVSSVEDLRSGSGSGSGSEGAEDAAMDADAEGDGDGSSIEDEGRSQVSSGRRNTVQQSHFTRPQQSVDPDAGADADTEMEGSQSNPQDEVRDQEQGAEDEERRTPRPSRRALAPLSSTSISQENSSTQSQAGPSSTPMGSRNQTITPSTTRPSRQSSSTSQSQSRSHPAPPTGAESHVQATRAAEQVQVTRGPPALNVDATSTGSNPLNGGEMAYREEEVLLSLQLLAYLSKYAHVRVLFHNAEMAVTALPGPLSALDDDFDMLPVACSEEHEHGSACARPHEPRSPPARNVFSVAERFTLRSSRSGSSVSATAHSKLAPEIQYWAGVIMRNACRKDEGRGGIRQCANMLCGKWEAYPREFAKCRRCRKAKYCSKACQSKGWQMGHRFWCSAREDEGREKEREKEKSGPSNGREDGEVGNSRDSEGHQDQQNPLNSATPSINTPTDENAIPSTSRPHNSSHNHHHHHSHRNSNAAASSSTSESHTSRRERRQEASSSHAGSSRRRGSGVLHHANSSETSFAAASASTSDVDTDASMTTAPVGGIDLDDVDAASTGRDSEEDVRRAHRPRPGRSQLQHQRQHAHQPATSDDVEEENERGHSHHGPLPAAQRTDLAGRPLPPPVIASHDASHVLGAGAGRNDDLDLELIGRRGTPGATHEAEGLFANGDFDQMRWRSNTLTPGSRNQPLPDVDDSLGGPTPVIGSEAFVQSSTHYHQDQGSSSSSSSSTTSYPNPPPSHLRAPVARQPHRFASTSGTGISGGLVVNSASSSSTFTPGHAHAGSGSGLSIGLGQPSSPSYAHFQRGYGLDAPGPRSASSAANFPPSRSPNATAASSSPSPLSAGPIFTSNSPFFTRSTSQPNGLEDYTDSLQHQSQEEDAMNLDDVVNQFSNDEDVQMN